MKKILFFLATSMMFVACASDDSNSINGDYTGANTVPMVKASSIVGDFSGGKMGVNSFTPGKTSRAADPNNLYLVMEDNTVKIPAVAENPTWKYFNLICNKASGLSHGENGWAARTSVAGTLDNNRKTYSWFYNDQGEKQNAVQNDQGLLAVGPACDVTDMTVGGSRAVVTVGNSWFYNSFARAQEIVDAAMATEAKTGYYQLQNGGDNTEASFTYYEYNGYKVVLQDYDLANGSCVVDGVMNENMKAPWAEGHATAMFPADADQATVDHKVIVVPTKAETSFAGRNTNANIFAVGKKLTFSGGAAPSGIVICDEAVFDATETHGGECPDFDFEPTPSDACDSEVLVNLDISGEFVVQADDFAIHNGDYLYERVAITEHTGVTDGNTVLSKDAKAYVKVDKEGLISLKVEDICTLYPSYLEKTNSEGKPYISEDGVLTLEVYIWPGTIDEETGRFQPKMDLGEGYIIGAEKNPRDYSTRDYNVLVSAFKGKQGVKEDGNEDAAWSYVKVSFHISPKK